MKKIFCLLLSLFILLCSISACADTADTPKNTEPNNSSKNNIGDGRFLYSLSNGTLAKIDLQERTTTLLCPDPLCDHGEDCVVSRVDSMSITNGYIYIERGDEPFYTDLYVYDMEKGSVELLASGSQLSDVFDAEKYVYFTLGNYEFDEENQVNAEIFHVYRYEPKTKKLEKVSKENVLGYVSLLEYSDETLTWENGFGKYFSTDYNFKNITELPDYQSKANVSNGYRYNYDAWRNETGLKFTMYKENIETGEKEVLFENADSMRWSNQITKDGFLYVPSEYQWVDINGTQKYVLESIRKIIYVDVQDPTRTFEYNFSENISNPYILGSGGAVWWTGDYTSVGLTKQETDENGNKYEIKTTFCINTKTGESFYIDDEHTIKYIEE